MSMNICAVAIGSIVTSPGNGRFPGGRYRVRDIGWQDNGTGRFVEFAYLTRLDNGAPLSKPPGSGSKVALSVLRAAYGVEIPETVGGPR